MKKCFFFLLCLISLQGFAQGSLQLSSFKLENGLTVYLLPDPHATKTFGAMVVNAGSKNDPADATGLAHYLEHLLFKGTEQMGTTDFAKEKPYLDSITYYYQQLGKTTDELARAAIKARINFQATQAAKYGLPTEFHTLLSSIGGTGINAFTAPDMTVYHNSFPGEQIDKWLDLYVERFNHPVFRSFQSELEVVYEEKNRGSDNFGQQLLELLNKKLFPNHPYGSQSTIGTTAHLKNPPIDRIYEFFQTYYVANNMALILSGNFDEAATRQLIERKMKNMRTGAVPTFTIPTPTTFTTDENVNIRISPVKLAVVGFKSVANTASDETALEVCSALLSNEAETGFLDKLQLDGKILAAQLFPYHQHDDGAEILLIVPKIIGQSFDKAEGLVFNEIKKLCSGQFSDTLLAQVKMEMIRSYELKMEDPESRGLAILDVFNCNKDWNYITTYPDRVAALTKDDIMHIATKYFAANHVSIRSKTGFPKKDKLAKPGYKPVLTEQTERSTFAKQFIAKPSATITPRFIDLNKDAVKTTLPGATLYAVNNPYNTIASVTINYQFGEKQNNKLEAATALLNYCSPASLSLDQFKSAMAALNFTYSFSSDDNFFTVELTGDENQLSAAIELMNQLLKAPHPSAVAMKNINESLKADRKQERKDPGTMGMVLAKYAMYGNASLYKDRLSEKNLKQCSTDTLLALITQAIHTTADIHLCSKKDYHQYLTALGNLPMGINKQAFKLNYLTPQTTSTDKLILVDDPKARQNQVYFICLGQAYQASDNAKIGLLNQYLCGSFSGLILQEVREFRSLAYSAGGRFVVPVEQNKPLLFNGFVGCQADKTNEAVQVMLNLLHQMPKHEDRIPLFKSYLLATYSSAYPEPRSLSESIANLTYKGYTQDPNQASYQAVSNLTFDDMYQFYEKNVQHQPVVVTIYGDLSKVNLEELKKQFATVEILKKDEIATY